MNTPVLTANTIRAGVWQGVVSLPGDAGAEPPQLEMRCMDQRIDGLGIEKMAAQPGHWALRLPIPATFLAEGVQNFLLVHTPDQTVLGSFAILSGTPLEEDLRAEIALLRAELDMLKKAFRRHCLETTA
jgi:hypothetical protein